MGLRETVEAGLIAARNVVLGANVAALPLVGRPRALVHYASETLFLYKAMQAGRGVTEKNVYEVLPCADRLDVTLGALNSGVTWVQPLASYTNDIVSLCLLARILKPKVVFEIGTLNGYTALHFALNSPADARVYTLDLPPGGVKPALKTTLMDTAHIDYSADMPPTLFQHVDVGSKVTRLFGDSATFDYHPYHKQVDLFFVDGAHSYEYVKSDTIKALECCHSGSVIAWHDFGRVGVNGVTRWLHKLSRRYPIYVVPGGSLAFMVVP